MQRPVTAYEGPQPYTFIWVSDHCRSEVNFALDQRCTVLVVHLEETQLSPGLRLALGTRQMILRYELRRTPTRGSSLARSAP